MHRGVWGRITWVSLLLFVAALPGPTVATVGTAGLPTPAAEPALTADGPALLRDWVPPVYPPEQLKQQVGGTVTVRLVVDAAGVVTSARAIDESDAPFVDAALAAVKAWRFAPATDNQKPVPCCLETLVEFSPSRGQQKPSPVPPMDQTFSLPPRTAPEPRSTPAGDYPEVLTERKLTGAVLFTCRVTAEGRVNAPQILAASHPDFVRPALQALAAWEFKPGMAGDLPVESEVEAKMTFDTVLGTAAETLAANGITAPDGTPPAITPEPLVLTDPAWPVERRLAGEGGSATVDFEVSRTGVVRNVRVREASQPDFGSALAAAVATWRFGRIIGDRDVEAIALSKRADVAMIAADAVEPADPDARLVLALRGGHVAGAKGLDGRITPLYRVPPLYPASLVSATGGPAGQAEIEFVIDREGRARLPRIVSASQPEFGWAAATAVGQWVFQPPTRAGSAVDVKVRIPVGFAAVPPP